MQYPWGQLDPHPDWILIVKGVSARTAQLSAYRFGRKWGLKLSTKIIDPTTLRVALRQAGELIAEEDRVAPAVAVVEEPEIPVTPGQSSFEHREGAEPPDRPDNLPSQENKEEEPV